MCFQVMPNEDAGVLLQSDLTSRKSKSHSFNLAYTIIKQAAVKLHCHLIPTLPHKLAKK